MATIATLGTISLAGCGDDAADESPGGEDAGEPKTRVYHIQSDEPRPMNAQYNGFGPQHLGGDLLHYKLLQRSRLDGSLQPELAREWTVDGAILDLELYPDHYWWDGTNVTADDVRLTFELEDYVFSDPHPPLDRVEVTGSHAVRFHLTERHAPEHVTEVLLVGTPLHSRVFYDDRLEQFEDANSEAAIDSLAQDLLTLRIDELEPMYNVAFELEETDEATYYLSRRDQADPAPRYVAEIEFDRIAIHVLTGDRRWHSDFIDGRRPYIHGDLGETFGFAVADADFDVERVSLPPARSFGAYVFDCSTPPTSSRHFRRAWAYLLDREANLTDSMRVDRVPTGVLSPWYESRRFDDAFIDELDRYGPDSVAEEAAKLELETGGFERDSDGRWLFADGDRAGEPMSFTIQADFGPSGTRPSGITGATQAIVEALADFGVEIDVLDRANEAASELPPPEEFEIALAPWGGPDRTTATTYERAFLGPEPAPNFPSTWHGPPVGSAQADETETYAIDDLVAELRTPAPGVDVETTLKRVAWVFNRALPRVPVGYEPVRHHVNASTWTWPTPADEHPDAWVSGPGEKLWSRGSVGPG